MHDTWLRQQRFDTVATQLDFVSDYDAVLAVTARRGRLAAAIAQLASGSEFTPVVRQLGACGAGRR